MYLKCFTANVPGEDNLRNLYTKAIQEQEQLSHSLRERQKQIKDTSLPNQQQMGMFTDLKKILRAKIRIAAASQGAVARGAMEMDQLVISN